MAQFHQKKLMGFTLIALTLLSSFFMLNNSRFVHGAMIVKDYQDKAGRILILTNRMPKNQSPVAISLGLDTRFNITLFGLEDDTYMAIRNKSMSNYDVVVCDSLLPKADDDQIWLKNEMIANNVSLLFFGGNYTMGLDNFAELVPAYFSINRNMLNSSITNLLTGSLGNAGSVMDSYLYDIWNTTSSVQIMRDQIQVAVEVKESAIPTDSIWRSAFTKNIAWQSCPLLRERVFTFSKKNGSQVLVEVPNTQEPLVVAANYSDILTTTSSGKVIFISTGVGNITFYKDSDGNALATPESKEMNTPFKLWPYFNYLMYLSCMWLDSSFERKNLESYADWPWSPIPHEAEAAIWMTFVASLWVFNFVLFFTLGKKKKARDAQLKAERPIETPPGEASTTKPATPSSSTSDTTTMPPKDSTTPSGDKDTTTKPPE